MQYHTSNLLDILHVLSGLEIETDEHETFFVNFHLEKTETVKTNGMHIYETVTVTFSTAAQLIILIV